MIVYFIVLAVVVILYIISGIIRDKRVNDTLEDLKDRVRELENREDIVSISYEDIERLSSDIDELKNQDFR